MKKYIYIITGLIVLYLILAGRAQGSVPGKIKALASGVRKLWQPLTGDLK